MAFIYKENAKDKHWFLFFNKNKLEEYDFGTVHLHHERFVSKAGICPDHDGDLQLIFYVRDRKTNATCNFSFNAGWSNGMYRDFCRIILSTIIDTMLEQHNAIRFNVRDKIEDIQSIVSFPFLPSII